MGFFYFILRGNIIQYYMHQVMYQKYGAVTIHGVELKESYQLT